MTTPVLTVASQVMCIHGGQAILTTSNSQLTAGGSPVLLESDIHPVVGCPFTVGVVYMPCVTIQWQAPATALKVNGTPVLLATSIGQCMNASGAPQGVAIVSNPAAMLGAL
jgi:hypothetical protein